MDPPDSSQPDATGNNSSSVNSDELGAMGSSLPSGSSEDLGATGYTPPFRRYNAPLVPVVSLTRSRAPLPSYSDLFHGELDDNRSGAQRRARRSAAQILLFQGPPRMPVNDSVPPPLYEEINHAGARNSDEPSHNSNTVVSPPSYGSLFPLPAYSVGALDLVKGNWKVERGAFEVSSTHTEVCFHGYRPRFYLGSFYYKAMTKVTMPTYAGSLFLEMFTVNCPSSPELSIFTEYIWGWETVMIAHRISTVGVSTIRNAPVYGQPLGSHPNLMFKFETPSKSCKLCFKSLVVDPYPSVGNLILSKPKDSERYACIGQENPVHPPIALRMNRWKSSNAEIEQFQGSDGFCIKPLHSDQMDINAQTHARELIRLMKGDAISSFKSPITLIIRTFVPGFNVQVLKETLHYGRQTSINVPVYACTNEYYDLFNISIEVEGSFDNERSGAKMCFHALYLASP